MTKPEKKVLPADVSVDLSLLIHQAQAGDLRAFEELVVHYQDKIYTQAYYLAGNESEAQDLAQEVFVRAYLSLNNFRHQSDLGTWLHRIAVNLWLNIQRQRKSLPVYSLDDQVETDKGTLTRDVIATDPASDPVAVLEEKELQEMVQQALQQLPEEYRTVLVLRELQGYSYDEIGEITKSALGTVKSRLNRARQALKKALDPRSDVL